MTNRDLKIIYKFTNCSYSNPILILYFIYARLLFYSAIFELNASMHYSQSTLINLSLCPIIGKQRNTNVGTHLCQFLPSLRSTVRIHCPLLLMRNDDDDQLLLLLANEDKLTSAAHRKSASSTIQKAFLLEIFL